MPIYRTSGPYGAQHRAIFHAGADCDGTCHAQSGAIVASTDSLGYPAALGYEESHRIAAIFATAAALGPDRFDEPEPHDADDRAFRDALSAAQRFPDDDYTGPDLDVDAVIAAANDATRGGAIRHDYLAALRERGAIRATNHRGTGDTNHGISDAQHAARYLDDDAGERFYD